MTSTTPIYFINMNRFFLRHLCPLLKLSVFDKILQAYCLYRIIPIKEVYC